MIICSDLEGVLAPEMWVEFAEKVGLEDLKKTTRDIPDYDELMKYRLKILAENKLKLQDIQTVIATLSPLPGAVEMVEWLRANFQLIILSDTFYEFAKPLMKQMGYPTLFCHHLIHDKEGNIVNYRLRIPDQKREAVKRLHQLNFKVAAMGDSYNDLTMLSEADQGILFCPPKTIIEEHPELPVSQNYDELKEELLKAKAKIVG